MRSYAVNRALRVILVGLLAIRGTARPCESAQEPEDAPAARPRSIEARGIENLFRLSPNFYSGGEPQGEEGFSTLKRLGIRTIISVDGAAPDVETAQKLGLRYVHLPVGYDGIPRERGWRLIKAARALPGPVFIHCHHGKHRGPAAAALCGIAVEGWTREDATSWMKQAGTSPNYEGLFATVANLPIPTAAELAHVDGDFQERAETPALVELMVAIDQRWDRLKAVKEAGFKTPATLPDVDPPHEALQLAEHFREMLRAEESRSRGAEFTLRTRAASQLADDLEATIRLHNQAGNLASRKKVEAAFLAVGKGCADCHTLFRDHK